MSYELRTPLNTILGFAEHLTSGVPGALNARQEEYVDDIVSGANTLKKLVNDILDLALVESGALRLELTRIDLCALLERRGGPWARMGGESVARSRGRLPEGCRRIPRRRAPHQAGAVQSPLQRDPLRAATAGKITLSGRIVGDDVQIAVADNGPGIAADVKAKVFDTFESKSHAGQRGGAGLGLALVNRFIELHDGWVEIETGHGTLVRCHLPRRITDKDPPRSHRQKRGLIF